MRWAEGRVEVDDSVEMSRRISGQVLRDGFLNDIRPLTLGLVRARGNSLRLGSIELLRLGKPTTSSTQVEWPIEGGLAAAGAGGSLRIEATGSRLVASVTGYRPRLPGVLYALTQLPIHHLVTRLHLLRVRGRRPAAGVAVSHRRRVAAAAIDVGLFAAVAAWCGRGRRLSVLLGTIAVYHVVCWSVPGRTVGGLLLRQRVVAVDGSRPSAGQALLRLLALPLAAVRRRATHDEIACTDVVGG